MEYLKYKIAKFLHLINNCRRAIMKWINLILVVVLFVLFVPNATPQRNVNLFKYAYNFKYL